MNISGPHSDYSNAFFDVQAHYSLKSARAAAPYILSVVSPKSIVDVGCGVGAWARAFMDLGVQEVRGVDGDYVDRTRLLIPEDRFQPADLATADDIGSYDVACCLEVAEHLDQRHSDRFVALLTRTAPVVVFSAAIPGQGGVHHVNEQWQSYWAEKFATHGFEVADCLRPLIWSDSEIGAIYRQNLLVFHRPESAPNFVPPKSVAYDLDRVHPDFWSNRNESYDKRLDPPGSVRENLHLIGKATANIGSRLRVRALGALSRGK